MREGVGVGGDARELVQRFQLNTLVKEATEPRTLDADDDLFSVAATARLLSLVLIAVGVVVVHMLLLPVSMSKP